MFKSAEHLHFERVNTKGLKLGFDAVFTNPSGIKFRITDVNLNVVVDDKLIGVLGEKSDVPVAKKTDFTVPVGITIKPEGTVLDDIKTMYGVFTNKQFELFIVGEVHFKALGLKLKAPVKYKQTMRRADFW
jgi:hypothetical protein